jgi:hypothetical protein
LKRQALERTLSRNSILAVLWELKHDSSSSVSRTAERLLESLASSRNLSENIDLTIGGYASLIEKELPALDDGVVNVKELADELGVSVSRLRKALSQPSCVNALIARLLGYRSIVPSYAVSRDVRVLRLSV